MSDKVDSGAELPPKATALMLKAAADHQEPSDVEALISIISAYLRVLNPIIDGSLIVSPDSRVLWCDASLLQLTGYSLEDLQEKGLDLIFPGYLDKTAHRQWVQRMPAGSSVNMGDRKPLELTRKKKDPLDVQIGAVSCKFASFDCRIAVVKKYSPPAIPGVAGQALATFSAVLGIFVKQPVYSALVFIVAICYLNWGAIRNDIIGLSQFVLNRKCAPLNLPEELQLDDPPS